MKKRKKNSTQAGPQNGFGDTTENAAQNQSLDLLRLMPWHRMVTASLMSTAAWPFLSNPETRETAQKAISKLIADMGQGVQHYSTAALAIHTPQRACVWEVQGMRLLHTPAVKRGVNLTPVLIMPSLINRAFIVDLEETHSFVAYLANAGRDVYVLDWGAPVDLKRTYSINDYVTQGAVPALAFIAGLHKRPSHVIGYCMGGTMAVGLASLVADQGMIDKLVCLAAPWDFHAGDGGLHTALAHLQPMLDTVIAGTGVLPVDWIQWLFAQIDPLYAFRKFTSLAQLDPQDHTTQRFILVERWLNDGVDMAGPAATQCLHEWYGQNQTAHGVWTIGPHLVSPQIIQNPVLVVAAQNDRLVPAASAQALAQSIQHAVVINPTIGHIGMMASVRAPTLVWQPIAEWLES